MSRLYETPTKVPIIAQFLSATFLKINTFYFSILFFLFSCVECVSTIFRDRPIRPAPKIYVLYIPTIFITSTWVLFILCISSCVCIKVKYNPDKGPKIVGKKGKENKIYNVYRVDIKSMQSAV